MRLVIKDLKSGIRSLDDLETLHSRLNILPHPIKDLYVHMLGGVSKLYWTEAAVYFRLLLAHPGRRLPLTSLLLKLSLTTKSAVVSWIVTGCINNLNTSAEDAKDSRCASTLAVQASLRSTI
jgi:hypothetical protein